MKAFEKLRLDYFPQPDVILLKHPVLLCHGFGAMGSFSSKGLLHATCMMLRERGVLAFAPNIAPYAKIETRAQDWAEAIDRIKEITGATKMHVVAHSMGGLDIRYAISSMDKYKDVISLTTVCTPHRGTSLSTLTLNTPETIRGSLEGIANWFGNNVYPKVPSNITGALEQLGREYVNEHFNPANPDHPEVRYKSVTAACGKGTEYDINRLLIPFNSYIYEREGINDGYISEESAKWGEVILHSNLSHPEQIKLNLSSRKIPQWKELWSDIIKSIKEDDERIFTEK
ncbi:MAG: hypothetical protein LAT84_07690 [Balneolia bacterium]|nr:hypothetical protein [Balneolia bacterium]